LSVKLLAPGHFIMDFGRRGSGKTTKVLHLAQKALDMGWVVFSNVLIGKKQGDVLVRATLKDYHHIRYLSDIFKALPDVLDAKRNSLVIVDESGTAMGFGAGQTTLSADVRAVLGWTTLLRKFRMCLVVVGLDETATMSKYREPGPIITFIIRPRTVSGYDARETFEIQGSRGKMNVHFSPIGIARPFEAVEDGEIVFETLAPAGFELGTVVYGKKFNPVAFFNDISDCLPAEMPGRIRSYFDRPSEVPNSAPQDALGASQPRSRAPGPLGASTQHGVKAEVVRLLNEGQAVRDIVEATGASKQYIYRVRQKLGQQKV